MSVDEDVDTDDSEMVDQFLDWLCWKWAGDGQRFYPPDETAEECVENFDTDEKDEDALRNRENGFHARAWLEAVEKFQDLESAGFDPVGRTERYIEQHNEEHEGELEPIDWEWWEAV